MAALSTIALSAAVCLVLVWVAYPVVMALLARGQMRRSARGADDPRLNEHCAANTAATVTARDTEPRVSVVIATRDDVDAVVARVRDCLAVEWPAERLDVVVACDASATALNTDALSRALSLAIGEDDRARVQVVRGDEPGGKSAALNAGVRAATGEFLVFTDSGQRFARDAVVELLAPVVGGECVIASGSLELATSTSGSGGLLHAYWSMERRLRRDEACVHSTIGVTGAIYGMRASSWTPLPVGLILDDVYVPMQLVLQGERVGFVREARAFETRRTTAAREYQRKVRTLTGVLQLCAWLPSVLVPVRNPVWMQFVVHKLLRLLTPYCVLAIVAWGAAVAIQLLGPWTSLALAAVAAAAVRLGPGPLRRLRNAAAAGLLMQWAVVVATSNGVRRRWHVWGG